MSISRIKTWAAEILTFSDLNNEFDNITDNQGGTFGTPRTAAFDMDGNELILDANGDTSITSDTDDQIDFRIGASDVIAFTAAGIASGTTRQSALRAAMANVRGRTSRHEATHVEANHVLEAQSLSF